MTRRTLFLLILCIGTFTVQGCVPKEKALSVLSFPKKEKQETEKSEKDPEVKTTKTQNKDVNCTISEGQAKFSSGWFPLEKSVFDIDRGGATTVQLKKRKKKDTIGLQVRFDDAGQKMVFCPDVQTTKEGERVSCTSIYALEDDFSLGFKRTFDVPKTVRGSAMFCGYKK